MIYKHTTIYQVYLDIPGIPGKPTEWVAIYPVYLDLPGYLVGIPGITW